jgi:hypothetical protein
MKIRALFLSGLVAASASWMNTAGAQNITTVETAAAKVEVRNLEVTGNLVSGEVVNNSPHALRNIELLVQYHWLWENEFKPGETPPGKSTFVTLDKELRAGESVGFTVPVEETPSPERSGRYMTEVTLAGFTEVIPPQS